MQKITLTTETRRCINPNTFLGYEGENNANKLVFDFTDGFLDGLAVLKVERGETKGTIDLVKANETYELEVKSSLLAVQGDIKFQFVITEADGTITKYDPFVMAVKDALDADGELPEEYPSWQEIIATELAKVEKATENANKVAEELKEAKENGEFNGENGISPEAKVERISNGVKITITDANGTTAAEVYDGKGTEVEVPTKTSQLENDSGFATENFVKNEIANAQIGGGGTDTDLSGFATKDDLTNKVDKVEGKSLIADTEIERLKNVKNYDDTEIKQDLTEISQELNNKADKTDIPDISGKQDTLVSGTNIKTINGESILGDGNIVIEGGSGGSSKFSCVNLINERLTAAGTYTLNASMLNYDEIIVEADLKAATGSPNRVTTLTIIPSMVEFPTSAGRYILHIADTKATTWNSMACEVMFGFNSDTEINIQRTVLGSSVTDRTYGISHIYGIRYR